MDIQLG